MGIIRNRITSAGDGAEMVLVNGTSGHQCELTASISSSPGAVPALAAGRERHGGKGGVARPTEPVYGWGGVCEG